MATITITINDEHVQRVIDAFKIYYEYNINVLDGETDNQFAKRMIAQHAKRITKRVEKDIAAGAAASAIVGVDIV